MKKGIICITGFLLLILMVGVAGACTVQRTDFQTNNGFFFFSTDGGLWGFISTDGGPWGRNGASWAFSKFSELLLEAKETAGADDPAPHRSWRHHRHFGDFDRLDASNVSWGSHWRMNDHFHRHHDTSDMDQHAPVPASLLLLASGLVGLVGYRRTINK